MRLAIFNSLSKVGQNNFSEKARNCFMLLIWQLIPARTLTQHEWQSKRNNSIFMCKLSYWALLKTERVVFDNILRESLPGCARVRVKGSESKQAA